MAQIIPHNQTEVSRLKLAISPHHKSWHYIIVITDGSKASSICMLHRFECRKELVFYVQCTLENQPWNLGVWSYFPGNWDIPLFFGWQVWIELLYGNADPTYSSLSVKIWSLTFLLLIDWISVPTVHNVFHSFECLCSPEEHPSDWCKQHHILTGRICQTHSFYLSLDSNTFLNHYIWKDQYWHPWILLGKYLLEKFTFIRMTWCISSKILSVLLG